MSTGEGWRAAMIAARVSAGKGAGLLRLMFETFDRRLVDLDAETGSVR